MDPTDRPSGRPPPPPPPKRELQGPRPTPLNVRKDSYKIKKPPVVPPQRPQSTAQQQPLQQRLPVIIYDVSPKVIHVKPSEFMSLVQRLTGSAASSSSSAAAAIPPSSSGGAHAAFPRASASAGGLSPAARLATYEKRARDGGDRHRSREHDFSMVGEQLGMVDGSGASSTDRITGASAGILSPVPSSLPAISPKLFSSLSDQRQINFFHDMSPAINSSFLDSNLLHSPSNLLFSTPLVPSPSAYWELFNQYQDL